MTSTRLTMALALALALTLALPMQARYSRDPNLHWVCVGCSESIPSLSSRLLFPFVRRCLHLERRNIYFGFDSSWMDNILLPEAKVKVLVVNSTILEGLVMPPTAINSTVSTSEEQEQFEVIVMYDSLSSVRYEPPYRYPWPHVQRRQPQQHRQYHQSHGQSQHGVTSPPSIVSATASTIVDRFLELNPCWLPLREPRASIEPTGRIELNGTLRKGDRLEGSFYYYDSNSTSGGTTRVAYVGGGGGNAHQETQRRTTTTMTTVIRPGYDIAARAFVLLRLPVVGYHATCLLYTEITRVQHPPQCQFSDSSMITIQVHNIGWSNTVEHVTAKFLEVLNPENYPHKVAVIPFAESFRARVQLLRDNNGSIFSRTGGWYWMEPGSCNRDVGDFDPWACNFISLSNCSRAESNISLMSNPFPMETKEHDEDALVARVVETLQRIGMMGGGEALAGAFPLGLLDLRRMYSDGGRMTSEDWVLHRIYTFLQRPNARLRHYIRQSLHAVAELKSNQRVRSIKGHIEEDDALMHAPRSHQADRHTAVTRDQADHHTAVTYDQADHHTAVTHSYRSAESSSSTFSLLYPCIVVHVRHGDAREDWRGDTTTDRSFEAHMERALILSAALAISNIFLATDNATVVKTAPRMYPELRWFTQRRPLKLQSLYEVKNEDDIQVELAHIIADLRLASTCSALVGSLDSGLTEQLRKSMRISSKSGYHPTLTDIRENEEYRGG